MMMLSQMVRTIGQWVGLVRPQPDVYGPDQKWRELSEGELARITGRQEPMSRAEAVLRLHLQDFEGFPHDPYPDRTRTDLYRFISSMRVEVFISDNGMDLRWFPSMLPGCEPIWAAFSIEDWVTEQGCLDELAAIAAIDGNLSRSLANLDVRGIPIALGIAALDAFFQEIPRIDLYGPDLKEVFKQYIVEDAMEIAAGNSKVTI